MESAEMYGYAESALVRPPPRRQSPGGVIAGRLQSCANLAAIFTRLPRQPLDLLDLSMGPMKSETRHPPQIPSS